MRTGTSIILVTSIIENENWDKYNTGQFFDIKTDQYNTGDKYNRE